MGGRRLRLLLVSQYFAPEVGATQARMEAFAHFLHERGHDVTVICEFPNHPHGVIPPEYRGRLVEDDRSRGYRVLRVWVKANPEKTQRTRLTFYLSFAAMATAVAPRAGRFDVVFATSPPLFVGAAGAGIAAFNRAPLVLDVRDLWPAAAAALDQVSTGWPLHIAEALERGLYRRAALVLGVTRPFCRHIDRIRAKPPRAVYLPNGTSEQFFTAEATSRAQLGVPEDSYLITYAGTHGIAQALPSVLDAAARSNSQLHFAFVGDGPIREALVESARERGLTNVSFHPARPPEEIPAFLATSDALLVPLSAKPLFRDFLPSKLIDCMAVGKPVLVAAAGEPTALLERARAGVAIAPEDPQELADAAQWLAEHPSEGGEMGRRGREFATGWLRTRQAERLEELLRDVARSRRMCRR
jgi:colanic acid biosynthesis glycosyl transferase WcaI